MAKDICDRNDIYTIVSTFYKRLIDDPAIGFMFADVAKHGLATHLAKVADFWAAQVFKKSVYRGDFYQTHKNVHLKTPLLKDHFDWWLVLFHQAIDTHASGPNAERMKTRATLIATSMEQALSNNEAFIGKCGVGIYDLNESLG